MTYDIRYYPQVQSDKKRLDPSVWKRIRKAIHSKLANKPQYFGEPLRGTLRDFWKLRVGDYRVGYFVVEEQLQIRVVDVSHRKSIYEQMSRRLS